MPETFTTEQMREMMKAWHPPELPASDASKTSQRPEVGSTDWIDALAESWERRAKDWDLQPVESNGPLVARSLRACAKELRTERDCASIVGDQR